MYTGSTAVCQSRAPDTEVPDKQIHEKWEEKKRFWAIGFDLRDKPPSIQTGAVWRTFCGKSLTLLCFLEEIIARRKSYFRLTDTKCQQS